MDHNTMIEHFARHHVSTILEYEDYRTYFNLPRGTWSIARDLGVPKSFHLSWLATSNPNTPYLIRCEWARRREDDTIEDGGTSDHVTDNDVAIYQQIHEAHDIAMDAVRCTIDHDPHVSFNPERKVTLHLGPTNSGKTRHAVEALVAAYRRNPEGTYIYAGPLRALAYEVRDKIAAEVGADAVGTLTGEMSDNPHAPIMCSTVEMAPDEGDVLIVDEAHWCTDPLRGERWVRLLTKSAYDHTVVVGPTECERIFIAMLSHIKPTNISLYRHDRLTPLTFDSRTIGVGGIPPRSAVIVFSRNKVHQLAVSIARSSELRVVMLYGAMPFNVRQRQIEKFVNGDADVIVTTDVIGHGINLPVDNVVIWETSKFDGVRRRKIYLWELAQIVGRAGRFGLSTGGTVYCGPDAKVALTSKATQVSCGHRVSELSNMPARAVVTLDDLALNEHSQSFAVEALSRWTDLCEEVTKDVSWMTPADTSHMIEKYTSAARILARPIRIPSRSDEVTDNRALLVSLDGLSPRHTEPWEVNVETLWDYLRVPIESSSAAFMVGVQYLAGQRAVPEVVAYFERSVRSALNISSPLGDDTDLADHLARMESASAEIRSAQALAFALRHTPASAVAQSYLPMCSYAEESLSETMTECLEHMERTGVSRKRKSRSHRALSARGSERTVKRDRRKRW